MVFEALTERFNTHGSPRLLIASLTSLMQVLAPDIHPKVLWFPDYTKWTQLAWIAP
jgi:hypothetical protein